MSKIKKVIIEYDDHIQWIKGEEAEKWDKHCSAVVLMSAVHRCNPFETDPIDWNKNSYYSDAVDFAVCAIIHTGKVEDKDVKTLKQEVFDLYNAYSNGKL